MSYRRENSVSIYLFSISNRRLYLDLEYGMVSNHGGPVTLCDEQDVVTLEEADEAHDTECALTHHQALAHHLADLRKRSL